MKSEDECLKSTPVSLINVNNESKKEVFADISIHLLCHVNGGGHSDDVFVKERCLRQVFFNNGTHL